MNSFGYAPGGLYLWTLDFEFHIISDVMKSSFLLFFPQPFKDIKTVLSLQDT